MKMLETEDAITFKKLGFNLTIISAVAGGLILISMYFS